MFENEKLCLIAHTPMETPKRNVFYRQGNTVQLMNRSIFDPASSCVPFKLITAITPLWDF